MHLPLTDDVINAIGIELEQRAENFAIGFAEWHMCEVINTEIHLPSTKELLEIYKKSL